MPASITITSLSWRTADGALLFDNLDLSFSAGRTGLVGRNGVGKSTLLALIAGSLEPQAGTITRQGRLRLLRQNTISEGVRTVGDLYGVTEALARLNRALKGDAGAGELTDIDWTLDDRLSTALADHDFPVGPDTKLAHLSGGQRTRLALGALMFDKPDLVLLDEPTNNLDREGRASVLAFLQEFKGTALVVSHDRALLEEMDEIVELNTLGARRYGGGFSVYEARKAQEIEDARHDLDVASRASADFRHRQQVALERKARRDGAGNRKAARGDMPKLLADAAKDRSEKTGGGMARLAESRGKALADELKAARSRIEVLEPVTVSLASTSLPAQRRVLTMSNVTGGHDRHHPVIFDFSLDVVGPERVALEGVNGSGKSTLLALITGRLAPASGTIDVSVPFAFLDQEVSVLDPDQTIAENFARLHPDAGDNACRAALARFLFRADAALAKVEALSGGERLRAGLACVLGGPTPPSLLLLDEPTNHLDLDAIAAVEAGLRAYDGALIVVSHDRHFLDAIGVNRHIGPNSA